MRLRSGGILRVSPLSSTIEVNNFIFEVKVILGSGKYHSGRPDGEAGNRTSYSPVVAGTGAELGNT